MADFLVKNYYNYDYLKGLGENIKAVYQPFLIEDFIKAAMDENWKNLELKERTKHITLTLAKFLPADYAQVIGIFDKVVELFKNNLGFFLPYTDFVETFGQDEQNYCLSINALEKYTEYSSAEFAIRPFIIKYEEKTLAKMLEWSKSDNEHIRRLASEGCRPALPWGQALVKYKKDPSPILPILENLKNDPSLFVRKSVANNLNDISKTHPDLVADIAKRWYGKNEHTNWIVKHACRTLLKKGNPAVLGIFGFEDIPIEISNFKLGCEVLKIGEDLPFSFDITIKQNAKVRLEYGIDFVKANGKTSQKIFQISESTLKENTTKTYNQSHSFKNLTTRKHYPGTHGISLFANGIKRVSLGFELSVE